MCDAGSAAFVVPVAAAAATVALNPDQLRAEIQRLQEQVSNLLRKEYEGGHDDGEELAGNGWNQYKHDMRCHRRPCAHTHDLLFVVAVGKCVYA
jgi:hypothetical protein